MSNDGWHDLASPIGTVRVRFSAHSDRGAVRKVNEDSFLAAVPVFIVADGMGGHAFGDLASQAAVQTFSAAFDTDAPATPDRILDALHAANDAVIALTADEGPGGAISGTTLTGVAFVESDEGDYRWMVFNVGDSRAYSWNGRALAQLSVDHSAVQELVDLGLITRREAERHPDRNIVTRALGADSEVDADVWLLPVVGHQTFLLCSDGLTKELGDDEIAHIIAAHGEELSRGTGPTVPSSPTESLAERLVAAAVAAGGSDNVTVVVVESEIVA